MANSIDLNNFDPAKFENDEQYQDQIMETPVGDAVATLFTSMTLQDCGEFIALVKPELLSDFFKWAEKNYPELEIDAEEAVKLVNEAVKSGEIGIQKP
jgi:hypothetical protein